MYNIHTTHLPLSQPGMVTCVFASTSQQVIGETKYIIFCSFPLPSPSSSPKLRHVLYLRCFALSLTTYCVGNNHPDFMPVSRLLSNRDVLEVEYEVKTKKFQAVKITLEISLSENCMINSIVYSATLLISSLAL